MLTSKLAVTDSFSSLILIKDTPPLEPRAKPNESSNIEVKVEKNGRLDSSFYLVTSEPEINWADESLVKEKFNNESKIQSLIKVLYLD